jgi:hypothetical protein
MPDFKQNRRSGAASVLVLRRRRGPLLRSAEPSVDGFAKAQKMAKQKFRPTRLGGFSGAKAYIRYVEVLKKRRNAVGRTFCDAISVGRAL